MRREHNITTETPLPSGYTRLNYIEATGTQYIDTNYYVGNKKTRIICDWVKTNSLIDASVLFGCGNSSDSQWFGNLYYVPNQAANRPQLNISTIGGFVIFPQKLNTLSHIDMTVDIPNGVYHCDYTDGENILVGTLYPQLSIYNNTLCLLSYKRGSTIITNLSSKAKLYGFIIYENDVLVHNYIPALRDLDSKPGLYDVAAGEFRTNNGTGEFLYA